MKKLRNINFYSVYSKISKRFLVFVRHKGQPVFTHLLRCEALAVSRYCFEPRALHLRKAWLVRNAG
jgi:hypothetical protein